MSAGALGIGACNGRLRDEMLNETLFPSLSYARIALREWRADYNGNRPHSRLGWLTPTEYATTFTPRRDLALRSMVSSSPTARLRRPCEVFARPNAKRPPLWRPFCVFG
ncbi:transposase [Pelagibacterium lacus]|uniref:Transposase n=1 Tax=Pelagibacterium lacus TaxID=2282655 RepID=A0A369W684_9HYPH|nr:transposase [Pelagibacterium lacus]